MTGEERSNPELDGRPDIYSDDTVECSFQRDPRETIKEKASPAQVPGTTPAAAPAPQAPASGDKPETIDLHASRSSGPSGFEITVSEPIGAGGMAEVDAATQESLDREVALKRPRSDRKTDEIAASLIGEARMLASLDHPNIPPVHQLGFTDDGQPVIVMKRVRGNSWRTLLQDPAHSFWDEEPRFQLKVHLGILQQVCNAVEYAHEKKIIHRDLKTDNVMVGDFGEVYLLDWGVAISLDENGERAADQFCGTLCFAAPEMLSSKAPLTRRTDVYLLGCILHEVLTLKIRHQGGKIREVIDNALASEPYRYSKDVHPALAVIANKATHRDPDQRYRSASEFRKAIEEHLAHYQALDLLNSTLEKMAALEKLYADKESDRDGFKFHETAYLCRFGFQRVAKIAPDLEGIEAGLLRVLELQTRFELDMGRIETAGKIILLIRKMQPEWENLALLEAHLLEVETKLHESNELSTQIQYKLMEELQKKKED